MPICEATVESLYGEEKFLVLFKQEFELYQDSGSDKVECISEECKMGTEIIKAIQSGSNTFNCAETTYELRDYHIIRDKSGNNPYFQRVFDFTVYDNPPIVYVYRNSALCLTCKARHVPQSIENVSATMLNVFGKKIEGINLQFCRNCKRYFIDWYSLKQYNRKYGALFFERNLDDLHDSPDWRFNPDSVLSRNGYAADGSMNAEERQKCVAMILEKGYATKSMIISHLASLIDLNGIRCYEACKRWEEDLRFVNRYGIEKQRNIGVVNTFMRR